jgi:hypothetical protein
MRQLSANVQAALEQGSDTIYLVRVTARDGTVIFTSTTYHSDLTLTNGYAYEANGLLVSADPPQLSTTVDREQYRVTVADPEFLEGVHAENGLTGKILDVRLGFINPVTGLPFLEPVDTFMVYRGRVDGSAYKINTEEFGESLLQITGISPILSLEMKKGIYLSRDAVRQRNANDSSCDQLYEGSSSVVLKWGR